MTEIDKMLEFNKEFVEKKGYEEYHTSKYPDKKIAIVTCMDTRLVQLLPAALGMKERGIDDEHISLMKHCGIDLEAWLHGFDDTQEAILETVDLVKNHPLVPKDIVVRGYIMDSGTGELERL